MAKLLRFRAWYRDETYNGSTLSDFKALPEDGLVVLVALYDTGRTIFDGGDWYYWTNGRIRYVPSVEWGRDEPRPDIQCLDCVKHGVGVPDDEFERILAEAWGWHGD